MGPHQSATLTLKLGEEHISELLTLGRRSSVWYITINTLQIHLGVLLTWAMRNSGF